MDIVFTNSCFDFYPQSNGNIAEKEAHVQYKHQGENSQVR